MSEHDTTSDDYRAGYLAGSTDRQGEVDRLENDADRFYRAAYGEERRIPGTTSHAPSSSSGDRCRSRRWKSPAATLSHHGA